MVEPGEIFADIEARPPSVREAAKQAYIGAEADWTLTFADGFEARSAQARLLFRYRPHDVKYVAASVPRSACPWWRAMRRGEPVLTDSLSSGETIWVYHVRVQETGSQNIYATAGSWCDEYVLTFDGQSILRQWTHRSYFHGGELMPAYCVPAGADS